MNKKEYIAKVWRKIPQGRNAQKTLTDFLVSVGYTPASPFGAKPALGTTFREGWKGGWYARKYMERNRVRDLLALRRKQAQAEPFEKRWTRRNFNAIAEVFAITDPREFEMRVRGLHSRFAFNALSDATLKAAGAMEGLRPDAYKPPTETVGFGKTAEKVGLSTDELDSLKRAALKFPGAKLYVDGKPAGTIKDLKPGSHHDSESERGFFFRRLTSLFGHEGLKPPRDIYADMADALEAAGAKAYGPPNWPGVDYADIEARILAALSPENIRADIEAFVRQTQERGLTKDDSPWSSADKPDAVGKHTLDSLIRQRNPGHLVLRRCRELLEYGFTNVSGAALNWLCSATSDEWTRLIDYIVRTRAPGDHSLQLQFINTAMRSTPPSPLNK